MCGEDSNINKKPKLTYISQFWEYNEACLITVQAKVRLLCYVQK